MKVYRDVAQGSADWFKLRLGIPTASCFDQIVTPKTGQFSKQAVGYAYRLLAEKLLKMPTESVEGQEWMERGKELEPQAIKQYEWVNEVETEAVGFITTDDGLIGASPDRLVKGKAVGVEVKCPAPHTHLRYLLEGQAEAYLPQVQGQLLVAELERVDFYSYHPRMPACTISTPRDEKYIELLRAGLQAFNEQLFALYERAQSLGLFQAYEEAAAPVDVERAAEADAALRQDFGISADPFGLPPLPQGT